MSSVQSVLGKDTHRRDAQSSAGLCWALLCSALGVCRRARIAAYRITHALVHPATFLWLLGFGTPSSGLCLYSPGALTHSYVPHTYALIRCRPPSPRGPERKCNNNCNGTGPAGSRAFLYITDEIRGPWICSFLKFLYPSKVEVLQHTNTLPLILYTFFSVLDTHAGSSNRNTHYSTLSNKQSQ